MGCVLAQLIVLIYSSVREIPDGEALNIEKKNRMVLVGNKNFNRNLLLFH